MNAKISCSFRARSSFFRLLTLSLACCLAGVQSFIPSILGQGSRLPKKVKGTKLSEDRRVAHVLARLTFGARPGDFERVKSIGVDKFIAEQLAWETIDDTSLASRLKLPTLGLAQPVLIEQYTPPKPTATPSPTPVATPATALPTTATVSPQEPKEKIGASMEMEGPESKLGNGLQKPDTIKALPKPTPPPKTPQMVVSELQRATLLRAVYSDRQLYELMVSFWENHFSIFANKDADRYLLTSFDRDSIRPFAMGRFRDLLGATAHSPAMLYYLDNWRSSVPRPYPATKDKPAGVDGGINENYARELMELHTLGVDGGYTQRDVMEVARCFTGWTIQKPDQEGLFLYRPGLHDNGEKTVLGQKIFPGGGIGDGERVLDILASHPSTARFIATKLARRFISDEPPESVISRAAAVFLKTDGSIRETLRSIITSPEFFSPGTYRAKMRSPLEYTAAALRGLNAETDGDRPLLDLIGRMGQPIFGRITPDGYGDRAEQWMSNGALLARLNFANALAANKLKGTKIDPLPLTKPEDVNARLIAARFISILLFGDVSSPTRETIEDFAKGAPDLPGLKGPMNGVSYEQGGSSNQNVLYVTQLITLVLGSPEFQRR
ncbi:MAG: hypothetical protein C5B55_14310 [Blastocatellia bacterium]|nr:MAG: hypothetical protein C5B55_14310 [Blastocatellia bacterium]